MAKDYNMKHTLICLFIVSLTLYSATLGKIPQEVKESAANVKKHNNVYVFMESEPNKQYEELGTIKLKSIASCDWSDIRDKLIKKVLKEYPTTEGVIITDDLNAIAIKFK
ncbi:conserved hypothetical protein [Azospirillaceae bacterium]